MMDTIVMDLLPYKHHQSKKRPYFINNGVYHILKLRGEWKSIRTLRWNFDGN